MNTLSLALRNLLRNRRRSFATLLAMMVGGVCILLFGGYVQNIIFGCRPATCAAVDTCSCNIAITFYMAAAIRPPMALPTISR